MITIINDKEESEKGKENNSKEDKEQIWIILITRTDTSGEDHYGFE